MTIHDVIISLTSFLAFLLCSYGLLHTLRAHIRVRAWYTLNALMLGLSSVHTILNFIESALVEEPKLQLLSIALRAIETCIVCHAFAMFSFESRGKQVGATTGLGIVVVGVIFVVGLLQEDVGCEHPLWLVLGVVQLSVAVIFFVVGMVAFKYMGEELGNARRRKIELIVLMVTFLVAAMAQVVGDAWRRNLYLRGNSCRFHNSEMEEIFRSILFLISFELPAFAVFVVYYFWQRHSLNPDFDVELPSLHLLELEMQENDDQVQHQPVLASYILTGLAGLDDSLGDSLDDDDFKQDGVV